MTTVLITFDKIFLNRDGLWYHGDTRFTNEKISTFFHQNIKKKDDDNFVLSVNGREVPIEVEDVVLWVRDANAVPEKSELVFTLSDGSQVTADKNLIIEQNSEGEVYTYLKGDWKTKIDRKVYTYLTNFISEENEGYFLKIGELKIPVYSK